MAERDERDLHPEPDLTDPGEALAHRAMAAIQRAFAEEFAGEPLAPNVTVIVSAPPDGRVGIASTEPDPETILLALKLGWGAVHHALRLRAERQ